MSHFSVLVIGDDVEAALAPYQENNEGDCPEQYLKFTEDEEADVDPKTGKRGWWENPNKKWDWWAIGGRYCGRIKVKPGATGLQGRRSPFDTEKIQPGFVDQARAKDIDWEGMRIQRLADRRKWWAEAMAEKASGKANDTWLSLSYDIRPGMTEEEYVATGEEFSCFAVVKDGKWYEKGEMGWFAAVSNEKDRGQWLGEVKALLADLPGDALLTMVDCHI